MATKKYKFVCGIEIDKMPITEDLQTLYDKLNKGTEYYEDFLWGRRIVLVADKYHIFKTGDTDFLASANTIRDLLFILVNFFHMSASEFMNTYESKVNKSDYKIKTIAFFY